MNKNLSQHQSELLILGEDDILEADLSAWRDGNKITVWFFSSDYALYRKLSALWDEEAVFAPVGEELNKAALRRRDFFLNLDGSLLATESPNLSWFASNIAERSPYASTFMLNACRLMILQDGLLSGGKHIVIVDKLGFGLALYRTIKITGVPTWWRKYGQKFGDIAYRLELMRNYVASRWTGLIVRARGAAGAVVRRSKLKRLRKRYRIQISELRAADVLLVVWARKNTFPKQGPITEAPFLGDLPNILNESGQKVAYLVLPMHWLEDYDDIVENALSSNAPALVFEDTHTLFSLMSAAFSSLFQGRVIKEKIIIDGHDLSAVVAYEKDCEWRSWRPGGARLFAQIGAYLEQHSIKPNVLFHLYENHSWEKCLQAGVRKHLKGARILGCQQSPFSPLYLNFIPSRNDISQGCVPDALLVSGHRFQQEIEASGYPGDQIYDIGSFRYQAFIDQKIQRPNREVSDGMITVLCATGPDVSDCIELVCKVVEAAAELPSVRVLVNFHPLTDAVFRGAVKDAVVSVEGRRNTVTFVDAPVQDLLGESDVVCYSDTNSVFEALSKGVPVIHVKSVSGLNYDKAPDGVSASGRSHLDLLRLFKRLVRGDIIGQRSSEIDVAINNSLGATSYENVMAAITNKDSAALKCKIHHDE